ncbi:T9SS type A sorting domain-containing protein [Pontibacter sp. G13]|uniref:T9SS type A sorting domain-containing protein n=1 Tax=Pontibacter sp. G13 TaxID=3074898 RepID=UPI00288A5D10|nr:T9SS type A sorting domain-containing protein [Pontibacter sp. G13]WNJ19083.1 T9SS type A sorting domain-containing protein [Pontibacter sp. G13]
MKKGYFTNLVLTGFLTLAAGAAMAQSTAGPIQITEFADSTNVTAGDNFPAPLLRGNTYTVKGSYGNIGAAQAVRISYDVYAADWSGLEYSHQWILADDTTGVLDGNINADITIPTDAALVTDYVGAFYIVQVRVVYDPIEDTFWNLFVEVVDGNPASIKLPEIAGLRAYPNPVSGGFLTVETPNNQPKSVRIFNGAGQEMMNRELMGNGRIDVSGMETGIYVVEIMEDGHLSHMRMLIK